MPRHKILFAITSFYSGGAENHTVSLIKNLNHREFETMLVATNQGGALEDKIKTLGIPYKILEKKSRFGRDRINSLKKIYREFRPNVIHSQLFGADYVARTAAISYPEAKVVSTIQNTDIDISWTRTQMNKRLAKRTDKFIAITEAVKKFAISKFGYNPEKIVVINNAIDLSDFLYKARIAKISTYKFSLVAVGRLTEQKGYPTLIKAFKNLLTTQKREIILNIIGDGEARPMLEKLVRDLELENNVKFWGNRAEVGPLLHKFDLFILTSNWEGLGNVFMEAMASGLPIVATNVGGIPEIVQNGRNGLLVPPGDSEQVRQALTKIITNNSLYEKMSAANFKDAKKRFDPKIAAQKHEDLYKNLLQKK